MKRIPLKKELAVQLNVDSELIHLPPLLELIDKVFIDTLLALCLDNMLEVHALVLDS